MNTKNTMYNINAIDLYAIEQALIKRFGENSCEISEVVEGIPTLLRIKHTQVAMGDGGNIIGDEYFEALLPVFPKQILGIMCQFPYELSNYVVFPNSIHFCKIIIEHPYMDETDWEDNYFAPDEDEAYQIFDNMLSNAIKYLPEANFIVNRGTGTWVLGTHTYKI